MKSILSFICVAVISLSAAAQDYSFDKDILYKGEPDSYTKEKCRLDVAYEQGGEGRPVIIWFS